MTRGFTVDDGAYDCKKEVICGLKKSVDFSWDYFFYSTKDCFHGVLIVTDEELP